MAQSGATAPISAPILPHILALDLAGRIARERLSRGYADLTPEEKAAVEGAVALDPEGQSLRSRERNPGSAGGCGRVLQRPGQILEEIFRRAREKWWPRTRDRERSAGAAPAERLLCLDGLGFGGYASRHLTLLYQQLPVRTARRKYPYSQCADLQCAQSRISAWRN